MKQKDKSTNPLKKKKEKTIYFKVSKKGRLS